MQWGSESRQAQGAETKPEKNDTGWWGIDGEIRERKSKRGNILS